AAYAGTFCWCSPSTGSNSRQSSVAGYQSSVIGRQSPVRLRLPSLSTDLPDIVRLLFHLPNDLLTDRHVRASTQNQALSSVLFLYRDVLHINVGAIEPIPRARTPTKVPVVLTP